jgi:hypothetical protein
MCFSLANRVLYAFAQLIAEIIIVLKMSLLCALEYFICELSCLEVGLLEEKEDFKI